MNAFNERSEPTAAGPAGSAPGVVAGQGRADGAYEAALVHYNPGGLMLKALFEPLPPGEAGQVDWTAWIVAHFQAVRLIRERERILGAA